MLLFLQSNKNGIGRILCYLRIAGVIVLLHQGDPSQAGQI